MLTNNQALPPAPAPDAASASVRPASASRPYRISFFWPIVFIGAGVLLLLANLNYLQGNVWDWVWRLWPLIFIAGGLDALLRGEFVSATMDIGFGGLFLASTLGYFSANPLEILLNLWPLFLVSAGLSLVFSRRHTGLIGSMAGALVMVAVLSLAVWLMMGQQAAAASVAGPHVTQTLDGATKANVTLDPLVGSLNIKALPEATALVDGAVRVPNSNSLRHSYTVRDGVATYELGNSEVYVGVQPIGANWNRWDLGLNPDVPISLRINGVAGDTNLDLTGLQVTNLAVNMAVGSTRITLPQGQTLHAVLSSAIGSTTLIVPPGAAVRVVNNGVLVAEDMPAGYVRTGGAYQSPNYAGAAQHIDVNVSEVNGVLTVREQTGR